MMAESRCNMRDKDEKGRGREQAATVSNGYGCFARDANKTFPRETRSP
jgi:hypothetical protein